MNELIKWLESKIEASKPEGKKGFQFDFGQHCAFTETLEKVKKLEEKTGVK